LRISTAWSGRCAACARAAVGTASEHAADKNERRDMLDLIGNFHSRLSAKIDRNEDARRLAGIGQIRPARYANP
jgi:hypothetical protein